VALATWPSHDHIFLYLARRDSTRKPIAQTDEMVDIAIIDWLGSFASTRPLRRWCRGDYVGPDRGESAPRSRTGFTTGIPQSSKSRTFRVARLAR
jgi:hypothetical protein